METSATYYPTVAPRRRFALLLWIAALAVISGWFYYRQNFAGQIGGEMSIAKLLWLDYAIIAWFFLPFFFCRSHVISPTLRWIYGGHLITFVVRGIIELWLLYITIAWIPPYVLVLYPDLLRTLWLGRDAFFPAAQFTETARRIHG